MARRIGGERFVLGLDEHFFKPIDIPWLCGGDFNEFIWESEKSGCAAVLYNRPRFLANFMEVSELIDLDFNGPPFT